MNSGNTAQSLQQNQPTSRLFFPPRDNLGVHSPERLGDVAVPADGQVAGENLGKLLSRELVPTDRLPIRSHQGRGIHMTESSETHVAKSTALSFIPIGHNVPDQAVVGIGLDLVEALLTAVASLRPARAVPQTRLRLSEQRGDGGLSCCDIDGFRQVRLRTSYDPFAAIQEISAHGRKDVEKNRSDQRGQ